VAAAWGDVNRRFTVHSIRKSLLNSLYGIFIANGTIDTNLTIGQLQITDKDSLSELEKSAKVIHLLKARSGVYHRAAAEPDWVKGSRPERNSHPPDSFWFYNKWDFNVLGTIFEKLANTSIYKALHDEVAVPLQMEDYRIMDGKYFYEYEYSDHPAYHLKMSARDLARYGQLFLQKGAWNSERILSEKWVEASTYPHSKHGGGAKIGRWFGYLWGVSEYYSGYGMYFASGSGGQILAIFPTEHLILVNLNNTYRKDRVLDREIAKLFDLILKSKTGNPSDNPGLVALESKSRIPENLCRQQIDNSQYVGNYTVNGREVSIIELNNDLVIQDYDQNFKLFPISPTRFFVEDVEKYLHVEFDEAGIPSRVYYDDEANEHRW
jgi:CubicO group peptidase (beta-lactamase class C family)